MTGSEQVIRSQDLWLLWSSPLLDPNQKALQFSVFLNSFPSPYHLHLELSCTLGLACVLGALMIFLRHWQVCLACTCQEVGRKDLRAAGEEVKNTWETVMESLNNTKTVYLKGREVQG